ncbi:GDSL esterase/lipase 1-like [Punica granatum]|uniref:GDSL esterase/lipase 1-like n=1 Tax=Punica granatum TaxID=22663 RepID=A0A218W2R9_PUNGR|nr:GDSL esterase/lipase 1-like [Punica granatum]OWM66843.1 hypothetical protein CDL15_Pgr002638 [Punica granatum]
MSHRNMSVSIHVLTILVALFIARASCRALPWHPENRTALFIFGDSLFDSGNSNFLNTTSEFRANFYPYGETFFKHPTGRFSDGRLIPDFIAEYAGLPLIPPYLQPGKYEFTGGANFATSGAGALAETYSGFVVDLKSQLRLFEKMEKQLKKNFGDELAAKTISEAVYLFSIGSGDYSSTFFTNSTLFQSHSHEEYVAMVIGNITSVISGIYSKGGRKFGVNSLGPIGCSPIMRALEGTGACLEELNELVKLHNGALAKALQKLGAKLDGFKYSRLDFFSVVMELIDNPSKYGFKEVKEACCGSGPYRGRTSCGGRRGEEYKLCPNPSDYIYFDSGHPPEKANQYYAELMWSGSTNVIGPYNLEELFKLIHRQTKN